MSITVNNPGFETDLSGWTLNDSNASTTWTRDTTITNAGSAGSSKLVNTTAGQDDYLLQTLTGLPTKSFITVTAWVNVTSFTAGAVSNRGLYVQFPGTIDVDTITSTTAGWVQKTTQIIMKFPYTSLEIRLYAPQATLYWDDVFAVNVFEGEKVGWYRG